MKKLIRITTVPLSLDKLLFGQLQFMNKYFDVIGVSSEKEYLEKVGKREGVKTHHIEMTRKITPFQDLISLLKLTVYFLKIKPEIVHSHTPKAGIVGMLAAKIARVPNRFHTVAGLPLMEESGKKRKILDFVEKLTYSCATKVYPNSNGLKNIILENKYCSLEKLKVLANGSSNGINTSYFSKEHFSEELNTKLKNSLGINENDFVFIFVGRLVTDKGINELVAAFSKIKTTHKQAKLLLVGPLEDDLDPLLPETNKKISINNDIISVGYQNDVRSYFAIANCLVFPSYREGFPNVVLQAGSMELPSIVSNINGCNEIIIEEKNGLIIPTKDENAILNAMEKVILNEDLKNKMQKNARDMIVSKYEQKVVWNALLKEYQENS